jgi:hypothetical protein
MLTQEAKTILANLDWLLFHMECKLDYVAGVVRDKDGEPAFMLEDLATPGLTPVTAEQTRQSTYGIRPHKEFSESNLKIWSS